MSEHPPPVQVQVHGRKRSNSFQRMLDLEKKLMLERNQGTVPGVVSPTMSSTDTLASPPVQQRRFGLVPRKEVQKPAPVPTRNYDAVPQPLVINTAPRNAPPPVVHQKDLPPEPRNPWDPPAKTPDKPSPKTVAFMFPPEVQEQRSVCQSPSWEAYGRRKREKKEEKRERKEEKKEKAQAMKDSRSRGRRLSKAPPPPADIISSMGDKSIDYSMIPARQIQPKPRPSSVLGIHIPRKEEAQKKEDDRERGRSEKQNHHDKKRSRSGSLTKFFRGSFEIRRASFDRDNGFIGGIKLEKEKNDFQQQVLEDQRRGTSRVHPALRKSFVGVGSFTPLKAPGPNETPEKTPKLERPGSESRRRAYPPISIQAASARNPGLLTPTSSPTKADFSNIYLWSARANRGYQSEDDCAVDDADEHVDDLENKNAPPAEDLQQSPGGGLHRSGGIYVKSSPPISYHPEFAFPLGEFPDPNPSQSTASVDTSGGVKLQEIKPPVLPAPIPVENKTHIIYAQKSPKRSPTKSGHSRGASFSSMFSIPPEPPKKSAKRNSMIVPSAPLSTVSTDDSNSTKDILGSFKDPYTPPDLALSPVSERASSKGKKNDKAVLSNPPSIPYERTLAGARPTIYSSDSWTPVSTSNNKWNLKDGVRSAFRRGSVSHTSLATTLASPTIPTSHTQVELPLPSPVKSINTQGAPRGHAKAASYSAPPSAFPKGRPLDGPTKYHSPSVTMSPFNWRPETSSSEDGAYSDGFPSISPPSTPNTSPPQSESGHLTGLPAPPAKPFSQSHRSNHSWSGTNTPGSLYSDQFPSNNSVRASDFDPIEAAARKVMEAFPDTRHQTHLPRVEHGHPVPRKDTPPQQVRQQNPNPPQTMAPERRIEEQYRPSYLDTTHKIIATAPLRGFSSTFTPSLPPTPISPQSPTASPARGHRATMSVPEIGTKASRNYPTAGSTTHPGEPVAKMFVECCSCKHYHDMPSKLYEAMANPDAMLSSTDSLGFTGSLSMTVKCPWCRHEMSTKCCAGLAAMVYIKERLH